MIKKNHKKGQINKLTLILILKEEVNQNHLLLTTSFYAYVYIVTFRTSHNLQ